MSNEKGRFWGGGSDSDSESAGSEVESDTDVNQKVAKMSRWVVESDSDSEDEGRVVKSAKEKHMDALTDHITSIRNGLKNNDWDRVLEGYSSLNDALEKVKKTQRGIDTPTSYVRVISDIDQAVGDVTKDDTKKMSKAAAKAFTKIKQVIRKAVKVEPLQSAIEKYRLNPVVEEDSEEEEQDEEEEDDEDDDDEEDEDSEEEKEEV